MAALAALIGAGGLGDLIFQGIVMADRNLLMAGSIPTALLAVATDQGLERVEKRLKKWQPKQSF